jgi:hypothetical protein
VAEMNSTIAELKPLAERVPGLDTSQATLAGEKERLEVRPLLFVLTVDSCW